MFHLPGAALDIHLIGTISHKEPFQAASACKRVQPLGAPRPWQQARVLPRPWMRPGGPPARGLLGLARESTLRYTSSPR